MFLATQMGCHSPLMQLLRIRKDIKGYKGIQELQINSQKDKKKTGRLIKDDDETLSLH